MKLVDVLLTLPDIKHQEELIEAQIIGLEKQATINFCQNLSISISIALILVKLKMTKNKTNVSI